MTRIGTDAVITPFPWLTKCPFEIALNILGKLDSYRDLLTCRLVCRNWSKLAADSSLYTVIDTFTFPSRTYNNNNNNGNGNDGEIWNNRICRLLWHQSGKHLTTLCLEHGSEDELIGCMTCFPDWHVRPSLKLIIIQNCINMNPLILHKLIQGSPSLTRLELSQCLWLDDTLAGTIASLGFMKTLKLENAYELTDIGLTCILIGLGETLESLHLSHCPGISFGHWKVESLGCCRHLKLLKHLFLGNCRAIEESFLPLFFGTSPALLQSVSLENLSSCVTDQAIQQLSLSTIRTTTTCHNNPIFSWQSLNHLNISGCYCITDCGFASLLGLPYSFMQSLVQNDLSLAQIFGSENGSASIIINQYDRSLQLVTELEPSFFCNWKSVNVSGCLQLTDRILSLIAVLCPFLKTLVITDCSGLSISALNRLHQDRPDISIERW